MKRIITAIVALPILIFSIWTTNHYLAPHLFSVILVISSMLALSEFYNLARHSGSTPSPELGYPAILAIVLAFYFEKPWLIIATFCALTILSLMRALQRPYEMNKALASVGSTVLGVVYLGLMPGFLLALLILPDPPFLSRFGPKMLTLFFAVVMMTDTGAYYTGRLLGRHKLAPLISPGKTVEGSVGGIITALLAAVICRVTFLPELPVLELLVFAAATSILGQIGDLAESMLKRGSGVKDSSRLLPGHGGFLDRLDSVVFCAPLAFYWALYVSRSL